MTECKQCGYQVEFAGRCPNCGRFVCWYCLATRHLQLVKETESSHLGEYRTVCSDRPPPPLTDALRKTLWERWTGEGK